MTIFPQLRATDFLNEFTTGKTRPCLLRCKSVGESQAGVFVVKFRASLEGGASGLLFEYLAARVAQQLGVPMPRAAWILVEESFADALMLGQVASADRIRLSAGLNFGTEFQPHCSIMEPGGRLAESELETGLLIVVFDLLIDNADRRREKPNLLSDPQGRLLVIDHEFAFSFTRDLSGKALWQINPSYWRVHPLYNALHRRVSGKSMKRVSERLERLTDDFLLALRESVPPELAGAHLEKIMAYFQQARRDKEALIHSLEVIL